MAGEDNVWGSIETVYQLSVVPRILMCPSFGAHDSHSLKHFYSMDSKTIAKIASPRRRDAVSREAKECNYPTAMSF